MKKAIVLVFVALYITGCSKNKVGAPSKSGPVKSSPNAPAAAHPKVFKDYFSTDHYFFWAPKQSDSSSYWVRLEFEEDFLVYQFHGQCLYYFFTNYIHKGADKVELLWSYKPDCLLNMDLLKQHKGVKHFPRHGDVFCEYKLINDSVIKAEYKFPEWVAAVNKTEHDSIFPTYFYLQK